MLLTNLFFVRKENMSSYYFFLTEEDLYVFESSLLARWQFFFPKPLRKH